MKRQIGLTADALSVLCYQLALLLKAGIGSEAGVGLLAEDGGETAAVLKDLQRLLSQGLPLSDALEQQGAFPDYMVRMAEIGQASGRLEQVLDALARYYRREAETRAAIRRAVLYPAVMAVLVAAVFLVLMVRVLPVFEGVFRQLGLTLSPLMVGLLRAGEAGKYVGMALVCLLAVGAIVLLVLSRRRAGPGGFFAEGLLGHGKVAKAVGRSRFAAAMALMLTSGLPLDEAVERTARLLEGTALAPALSRCQAQMATGAAFSAAVASCGLLDALQASLLGAGIRAGSGETAMEELASRCQGEADERLAALLSHLEFGLVALLCLAVGLVLLSVMLPLLGVLSAIG